MPHYRAQSAVVIWKDGSASEIEVIRGLGNGLDESAVDTVKTKWRFRPAVLIGQPVNVYGNIEVCFRLF